MGFEYRAFISYSHRDTRWAEWLLHALETYRLPDSRARGVGRVFRDRDEAGAGDLKAEIERALAASEHLIVIASPNSARSAYVDAEIRSFAAQNARREKPGRILTLIVDGEPNVAAGDTPHPRECFAPALRGGVALPDGTPLEPLAADARAVGDGRTRALAKLVAGLLDIRYDNLVRRDLMRRRRNRLFAGGAAVASLAIAAIVTGVIVMGNLEQERLRVASETAAREARTVTAVNDAERARRLLEGGNPSAALALARTSLPLDGSVPFVPQAYDVLYRSIYDRTQEVEVDLAGYYGQSTPVVLPAGEGHYLIYNDSGSATIWSAASGVVYRRTDLDWGKRPSRTLDGSAIFVPGAQAMQRLALPGRNWNAIDLSSIRSEIWSPDHLAAIDGSSFYACRGVELMKVVIDDEFTGTAEWRFDLPAACSALNVTPGGNVVVAVQTHAAEFDAAGELVRVVGPIGENLVERVYATEDALIAASVGGTWVYPNDNPEPTAFPGWGMDYSMFSPDGRWFVYSDLKQGGLVVNDLRDGTARTIACECWFAGFMGDNEALTAWGGTIESYRLDTLEPRGIVHVFGTDAESFAWLGGDNLLMALRRSGPESIAFLDEAGSRTMLVDGSADLRAGIVQAAFSGTRSVLTREIGPDAPLFRLIDTSAVHATGRAAGVVLPEPARFAGAVPLAGGRIGIVGMLEDASGWTVAVYDGDSGTELWAAPSEADPRLRPGDRFIAAQGEDDLTVFDVERGTSFVLADFTSPLWDIEGDMLVSAAFDTMSPVVTAARLDGATTQPLWSQPLASMPYLICLTRGGEMAYLVRNIRDALQFEQRDLADGVLRTAYDTADTTMLDDGSIRAVFEIDCDGAGLRMSGLPSLQWRWDVAGGAIVAEPKISTPPRGDAEAAGFDSVTNLAALSIGASDNAVWLYDPSGNRTVLDLPSVGGRVSAARWIADRGFAVLGFESGRLEVWDARHASAAMISLGAHTSPVVAVDYDAARNMLLSADQEGTIHLWPLLSAEQLVAASGS